MNLRDLKPGDLIAHRSGTLHTLARRKDDDSGWWLTDGGGLTDWADLGVGHQWYDTPTWVVVTPITVRNLFQPYWEWEREET